MVLCFRFSLENNILSNFFFSTGSSKFNSSESRERSNADSAYLSPVFNQNENGNTGALQGHSIIHGLNVVPEEQALGRQRFIHDIPYAENDIDVPLDNRTDHVYIEIADDSEENSNVTIDSNIFSSNMITASLDGSVVYINQ